MNRGNMEDRIKVGMRVSFEWLEPNSDPDPRPPVSKKKGVPVIKCGMVETIEEPYAAIRWDDGTSDAILLTTLTPGCPNDTATKT